MAALQLDGGIHGVVHLAIDKRRHQDQQGQPHRQRQDGEKGPAAVAAQVAKSHSKELDHQIHLTRDAGLQPARGGQLRSPGSTQPAPR